MNNNIVIAVTILAVFALTPLLLYGCCGESSCCGQASRSIESEKPAAAADTLKPQDTCPVMGGKVDRKLYVDVKGSRVYVCCNACIRKVKADPDKYLEKIKANGEVPEKAPEAEVKEK